MIFGGLMDVVLIIFVVLFFAEYMKMRNKYQKAFGMIAASGLFFLLAAVMVTGVLGVLSMAGGIEMYLMYLFEVLGLLLLLVGVLMGVKDMVM